MTSEPCRHERADAPSMADMSKSFKASVAATVKAQRERDEARARNERQRETLANIRAIVAEPHAAFVVSRVLAVLDGTS